MEFIYSFTAFISGFAILGLEILGFRIFAPYFGASVFVSGSLIGVVLLTLSLGYYIGGFIADKKRKPLTLFSIILGANLYLFFIIFSYIRILDFLSNYGPIKGSLLATTVIFGLPMLLLSMVPPMLIKMTTKKGLVGTAAGKIYALSTLGSLLGTFLTTFVLIPLWGSLLTLKIIFLILLLPPTFGFVLKKRFKIIVLFPLLLIMPKQIPKDPNTIFQKESFYNLIKIKEDEKGTRFLFLNQEKGSHSLFQKKNGLTGRYYDLLIFASFITSSQRILVLGMGGGTTIKWLLNHLHHTQIDAVEIDKEVVKAAFKYMGLQRSKRLKIFIQDARQVIKKLHHKYDSIEIDLFHGGPYIPSHVITLEFFQRLSKLLKNKGIISMNVFDASKKKYLLLPILNTIAKVFYYTYYIPIPGGNYIVYAMKSKAVIKELQRFQTGEFKGLARYISSHIQRYHYSPKLEIFKDDFSSLDLLTYKMLREIE